MRVELEKLRLGFSDLTGAVYAYIPTKEGSNNARHKKDVTKDFEACKVMHTNFHKEEDEEEEEVSASNKEC